MTRLPAKGGDPTRALISAIAMDIGKEVVAYIESVYPGAIRSCSSTFKLSVRNCIHNQIMAAIEVNDEGQIIARLNERKRQRRKIKSIRQRVAKVKPGDEKAVNRILADLAKP